MPATVTIAAFPGQRLSGRVSYIDPQVSPETRTAKVRIEVPNPRQELRLGMLAEARLGSVTGGAATITVPRRAVQTMGDRSVVYIVNRAKEGGFLERTVLLGAASADAVVVMAGLEPGDVVVSEGSFSVRAERERLGLGDPAPVPAPPEGVVQGGAARNAAPQVAEITVTKDGFGPTKVVRAGTPLRLTFLRTTDETCATEVVVPSLKIKRALPLNKPVDVEFTPEKAGTIDFACGMAMFKGAIVVE